MFRRSLYILIGVLMMACSQESEDRSQETGVRILEEAEAALANDGTPIISRTSDWRKHCRRVTPRKPCD